MGDTRFGLLHCRATLIFPSVILIAFWTIRCKFLLYCLLCIPATATPIGEVAAMPGDIRAKLGNIKYGHFKRNLADVKQFIFIRHGEKDNNDQPNLNPKGFDRAANLIKVFGRNAVPSSAFNSPDVIYAMKQGDDEDRNSDRPFETVQQLAVDLGFQPMRETRNVHNGLVFDNKFKKRHYKDMKDDIVDSIKDGDFPKNPTIMVCWEHQAIPYIVAEFGLVSEEAAEERARDKTDGVPTMHWGADPFAAADAEQDFTAIWVLTPLGNGKTDFEVYKEFDLLASASAANEFTVTPPPEGYGTPVATSPGVLKHN